MKDSSLIKILKEIGNTSNIHPWVLRSMEDLRDDLDFYLGPKNQHSNSRIDFGLLSSKMRELLKLIKTYHG
jgi:hypothetical protein